MGVGDERHLQGAVSRTERAAGLWSGLTPTTRSGRVRRDPPGYPERLREVAPGRAQVSGPVDRVSAFHYRLKVTHGQGLGKDNRQQVVLIPDPCARPITNLISLNGII